MRNLLNVTLWACRDTLRLRGSLATTVAIVCGVCLPLVLLQGLADGTVRLGREELLQSETACRINLWTASGKAQPLSASREDALLRGHGDRIAFVCPEVKKVVGVCTPDDPATLTLTLLCTKPGDPYLAAHHVDVLQQGERGVVLGRQVADQLRLRYDHDKPWLVEPGQRVKVTATRQEGVGTGTADVVLEVRGVIDLGEGAVGFAERRLLDDVETWQQGYAVPELDWPAGPQTAPVAYAGYLCFAKQPLEALDHLKLRARGLNAVPLESDDPSQVERRTLGGLLTPHPLSVYLLQADDAQAPQLTLSAREVEDVTDADDVVVPWSEPLNASVADLPCRLIGVSLHKRWLQRFFQDAETGFPVGEDRPLLQSLPGRPATCIPVRVQAAGRSIPFSGAQTGPWRAATAAVGLGVGTLFAALPALVTPTPAADTPGPCAVIPANCLALLYGVESGAVQCDAQGRFSPAPQENLYYEGRVYARSLDDVLAADALLREEGYATRSERDRVAELQRYAHTLNLLVAVVGSVVLAAGLFTLASVLFDNTTRKRGSLGLLRLLGVSAGGLAQFVLTRALVLGLISGTVLLPASLAAAQLLTGYVTACDIQPVHLAAIFGLAVGACLLGGVRPALWAARIDPSLIIGQANDY